MQFFVITVGVTIVGLLTAAIIRARSKPNRYAAVVATRAAFAVAFLLNFLINFSFYQLSLSMNPKRSGAYSPATHYMSLPFATMSFLFATGMMQRFHLRDKTHTDNTY